ncbi:MAG: hypothetical protein PHP26_01650 [Syntrophomonas sp.]|nr:hypothetical protein [Syntrophomonas sp.]
MARISGESTAKFKVTRSILDNLKMNLDKLKMKCKVVDANNSVICGWSFTKLSKNEIHLVIL